MTIYILNVISIPIYYLMIKRIRTKNEKNLIVVFLICMQMIFIAGMRGVSVGTDTQRYNWIFDAIKNLHWKELHNYYIDFGYSVINKLVSSINGNFRVMLFVNAIIIYFGIYNIIKKNSVDKIMSIFLFISMGYFSSSLNVMRQFIALTFVILSYSAFMEKKSFFKITFYCIIAGVFHSTALLCLGAIILYALLESKKVGRSFFFKLLVVVISIGVCFSVDYVFTVLGLDSDYLASGAGFTYSIFNLSFLIKIVLLIAGWYIIKKCKNLDSDEFNTLKFLNFLNIVSCFMNVMAVSFNMFTRLNIYFSIGMIVLIPNIIKYLPIKNKIMIKVVVYTGFSVLLYSQLVNNDNLIIPYNTIL